MNKIGYQPMPVLLRAESNDARWTSDSARFLRVVTTLSTVFALCGVIAIFLIGFSALPPQPLETKGPVEVPVLSATSVSPAAAPSLDQGVGVRLPDTNQVLRGAFAENDSIVDQPPTAPARNPDSAPAQVSHPEASASDGELLKRERPEDAPLNLDRHLSEAVRKNLERARRQAERKRSRLEDTYRKHAISSDAYKKGEEQYRTEIEKYRAGMNARTEPKN
jgi:hypothetical protein